MSTMDILPTVNYDSHKLWSTCGKGPFDRPPSLGNGVWESAISTNAAINNNKKNAYTFDLPAVSLWATAATPRPAVDTPRTSFYSINTAGSTLQAPPRVTQDGPPSEIIVVIKASALLSSNNYHHDLANSIAHLDDDEVSALLDDPDQEDSESDEIDRLPDSTYNVVISLFTEDAEEDIDRVYSTSEALLVGELYPPNTTRGNNAIAAANTASEWKCDSKCGLHTTTDCNLPGLLFDGNKGSNNFAGLMEGYEDWTRAMGATKHSLISS